MYCSEHDFANYNCDFYLGALAPDKKAAVLVSMNALRHFGSETVKCRRRMILDFFQEVPPWSRCQRCDNCRAAAQHGDDVERNFRPVGALILTCLQYSQAAYPFPISKIFPLVSGSFKGVKRRDSSDYFMPADTAHAMKALAPMRDRVPRKDRTEEIMRELLPPLVQLGYATRKSVTTQQGCVPAVRRLPHPRPGPRARSIEVRIGVLSSSAQWRPVWAQAVQPHARRLPTLAKGACRAERPQGGDHATGAGGDPAA
jgi:hypothetical protein